ncbi:MAG: HAD family phosphatase [Bacteroidota bacterium]
MKREYNTIVFDLGGVLIDWNPRHLYQHIFRNHAEMEFFLKMVCDENWNHQLDEGRSFEEAVKELSAQYPLYEPNIMAYWERWEEMLGDANGEMVALQKEFLKSNAFKVYALTNWSAETMPIAKERFSFLDTFDGMVVSGEEKCAKPGEKIFKILFDRYSIDPAKTIFIDDSLKNIATARNLGLEAIHFRKNQQVLAELARLGVLPATVSN